MPTISDFQNLFIIFLVMLMISIMYITTVDQYVIYCNHYYRTLCKHCVIKYIYYKISLK